MPGNFFERLVDDWDERAAAEDDHNKFTGDFRFGVSEAFPDRPCSEDLPTLLSAARAAIEKADAYYRPQRSASGFYKYEEGWLSFPSEIITEDENNNTAFARIFERRRRDIAVLLVPHWNSRPEALVSLAKLLDVAGFTAAVTVLPYHGRRTASGSVIADRFLSANVGRTVRSVRQSVLDLRGVIDWLEGRGYRRFYVVGASLGTCVAGLTGLFDSRVRGTLLMLTAGSFTDVVWTGRATRHVKAGLESGISLDDLREIWSLISLDTFAARFGRADHRLALFSARRDKVIIPKLTKVFTGKLSKFGVDFDQFWFPCGHYSLGMAPFSLAVATRLLLALRRMSQTDAAPAIQLASSND